jgi:hypothetical protein
MLAGSIWRRFWDDRGDDARTVFSRSEPATDPGPTVHTLDRHGPLPIPVGVGSVLGLIEGDARRRELAACAAFWGLGVDTFDSRRARPWSLVAGSADLVGSAEGIVEHVRGGGTALLLVDDPASLRRCSEQFGIAVPGLARAPAPMRGPHFPADRADLTGELAGSRLDIPCGRTWLTSDPTWHPLVLGTTGLDRLPLTVDRLVGDGRLVVSVLPTDVQSRVMDAIGAERGSGLLLVLMLLRRLAGDTAWHPPARLANLTLDGPALRTGRLGLAYDRLASVASEHGLHVTVATIPGELDLAQPAVVGTLRDRSDALSACLLERPSPEPSGAAASRFAAERDLSLDPVLVLPRGPLPPEAMSDLWIGGMIACSSPRKRRPAPREIEGADLGLRPAELSWGGFPLLWRRSIRDDGYLLDAFFGAPALFSCNPRDLVPGFEPLADLGARVSAGVGEVRWCGLGHVARHAYLQRRDPDRGWRVLMTGNEACLHNPDPDRPRIYVVARPRLPPSWQVDDTITVPAAGSVVVRVSRRR